MTVMTPVGGHEDSFGCLSEKQGEVDKREPPASIMNGGHWLICADGQWPKKTTWEPLVQDAAMIIACDGAYHQCLEYGVSPDVIIGDMDSIGSIDLPEQIKRVEKPNQERNDLAKALAYAEEHSATNIDVIGIEGGTLGHKIAPLFALYDAPPNTTLHFQHGWMMCARNGSIEFDSIERGSRVSLFAIGPAKGVHLEGCEWPLRDETLEPGTRGLNNISAQPHVKLNVKNGAVVICIEPFTEGP